MLIYYKYLGLLREVKGVIRLSALHIGAEGAGAPPPEISNVLPPHTPPKKKKKISIK